MIQESYNFFSILMISLNLLATILISIIGFSKTKKLQVLIEKYSSAREILQREYDLRIAAIQNSEKSAVGLFYKIDELMTLLKSRKIEEADGKLKLDIYKYYWENVLFIPTELQEIYFELTNIGIEATIASPEESLEYFLKIEKMNKIYFKYIDVFRNIYYYKNSDMSIITQEQFSKLQQEMKAKEDRITIAST